MPVFQPPTADTVPPVLPRNTPRRLQHPIAYALFRRYKRRACGRSVLKINGAYQTIDYPTTTQTELATEVYLGGHIYEVSDDIADALTSAGYGANIT